MLLGSASAQLALDLVGIFVFALSGGLLAVRHDFDLFGVLVLSGAAGLGGGVLRDVLLGDVPPPGISDWRLVATALAGGLVVAVAEPALERTTRLVQVLDAVGLGAFCVAGALKGLALGATPLAAVLAGVLTGVGGGALRDLLAGEVPQVLRHRELYATPAVLGGVLVVTADAAGVLGPRVSVGCAVLVVVVRLAAVRWGWAAPGPVVRPVVRPR